MGKYIDADRLKAEIDRRMTGNLKADSEIHSTAYFAGAAKEDYDILSIIDSLQQEQPEVDLEKETKRWWKEHLHLNPENQLWMDAHQSVVFARHFYELGKTVNDMDKIARIRQQIEENRQAMRVLNELTAPERMSKTCAIFQYSDSILSELLSFLDALSEEPDKSLEEAAEEYASINCDDYVDYESNISYQTIRQVTK